jgi:hypothetical protein
MDHNPARVTARIRERAFPVQVGSALRASAIPKPLAIFGGQAISSKPHNRYDFDVGEMKDVAVDENAGIDITRFLV